MSDIYQAPEAELTSGEHGGEYGSLEKGLAGDYSLPIGGILSEAWRRISGNKGSIWLGVLLYIFAYVIVDFIAGMFTGINNWSAEGTSVSVTSSITDGPSLLHQLIITAVTAPLTAGLMMIGIKIARDEVVSGSIVYSYFDKIVPLAICSILMGILIVIGFILLVLPGIYLSIAYMLALPLIVDKGLGPWEALETSRKAITKHWFAFFGLGIVCILVYLAGALALMIGLIWAIPTVMVAGGIAYRNIFGRAED
ncbi:hypothetical protein [Microbulbifer yueqingensis]|uniref:Membrane domain of glycerophosphoryl diester phosphodiesterase n=1 Tax=Microbulbifer yueqingensis TaxID=658219 RepID=A0A1G9DDS4_9GAMM|nr:hypothetical protein [Microbulbifer yueqingensis]SDK62042.1 hypothetical protein SAMN05216212_2753 [Microbulbifer yueqingensis]